MSQVKIRGLEIDLSKVTHPKLRRIVLESEERFLFFYKEGTKHSDSSGIKYDDHRDYSEYKEKWRDYDPFK